MIKCFLQWLKWQLFGSWEDLQKDLALSDLRDRLRFAEERADRWEAEAKAKTNELHMFVDALLMENGRTPLYATPVGRGLHSVEDEPPAPKPPEDPYAELRGVKNPRKWSNIASALDEKLAARVNGGV